MNPSLENYIKQAKQTGKTDEIIRQELKTGGWTDGDISQVLQEQVVINNVNIQESTLKRVWKRNLKFIVIIILIPVVVWYVFVRVIAFYYIVNSIKSDSQSFSSSPCRVYEVPIDVPELMKTSSIIFDSFEGRMYRTVPPGLDPKESGCQNMRAEANGRITVRLPSDTTNYKIIPIKKTTRFTLIRAAEIKTNSIMYMDSGIGGDYYLLKDEEGREWFVSDLYFTDGIKPIAGYYDGDKRLGDVVLKKKPVVLPTTFEDSQSKRGEFMKRIMFAIDEGKLTNFTEKEVIDNNLLKGLYSSKNGEIISNYQGKITLKKRGDLVSVIFEKIPKGEDCVEFIYDGYSLGGYGFKQTYFDGDLLPSIGQGIIDLKKKACYSGRGTVTVEFKGVISDIQEQAKIVRDREKDSILN